LGSLDSAGHQYLKKLGGVAAGGGEKSDVYVDEWKVAVETSQKFDEMLVDLRKYGFSILTGLITAGSFLGFSSKDLPQFAYTNIIHVGVINVSMYLVLILFWLDIYYQNLLYGSVLRTRFLETCRLKFKLSTYISGLYTGSGIGKSGMANILYLIYIAFLLGTFLLGIIVASLPIDDPKGTDSGNRILLLLFGLLPSGVGMLIIGIASIRSRDKTLTEIVKKINGKVYTTKSDGTRSQNNLTDAEIDELDLWIVDKFQPRVQRSLVRAL
jgi:hypothetical protein